MPIAVSFADERSWIIHFQDHGNECGAATKELYFAMAKTLIEADLTANPDILECTRSNGDILRFNHRTNEFAVVTTTGTVKTYFKPMPRRLAPPSTPIRKTHRFRNNMTYFRSECRK